MKNLWLAVMLSGTVIAAPASAWGQMHRVAKPQQVVRAVGVYEWTGDMAKPTASRLIPISLYMNGTLEDAGVYLARPVPFALETGNVYELQKAGVNDGQLDLEFARKLQTEDGDGVGWFGYGSFKPPAPVKKAPALHASKTLPVIVGSKDDSRPHFGKADGTAAPADETKDSSATTKSDSGTAAADDSDRPTMIRRKPDADNSTTTTTATTTASANENTPADDPDRPTLKRRTPAESKKAIAEAESSGTGAVESLNNDPDRPNLHYGRPAGSLTETELPKLVGMPSNLHQMVAVSDAVDRDPHDFSRPWVNAAERATVLAKMEAMAQTKLAQYDGAAVPAAAPAAAPKKTTVHGKVRRKTPTAAASPVMALLDEDLKSYTLSYGGAATYIYMAHTAGTGAALRYVTVVAQADDLGELKPALQSVTDAAHMDRTPEMKFVDVVDADASNRASLLFELKAQSSRQFVLYRVIASEAQLIFAGGSVQ